MKKLIILFPLMLISLCCYSQFEHKMSVNLSFGGFKTFGYATGEDDYTPLQMPHYKPGIKVDAGLQYNISRQFSAMFYSGIMYSWKWKYVDDDNEWLFYEIEDPVTEEVLTDGYNELKFFNFSAGVIIKMYISPGQEWNPYIFAGLNFNHTKAYYADNWWYDMKELDLLSPDDTEPYSPFLEYNNGIGFIPGVGIEYNPGDKYSLFMRLGYSLILLKEENFEDPLLTENFNAVFLQAGIQLNFLKSKKL